MAVVLGRKPGGGGGSSAPSGPAGGDLAGTYPNPGIAPGVVDTTELANGAVTVGKMDSAAAIDGTVLTADGAGNVAAELPPGFQFDYAEITTSVTVSDTTSPGDLVVTLPARTYDGSTVIMAEFCAIATLGAAVNSELIFELFGGAAGTTLIGRIGDIIGAEADRHTITFSLRLTPSAGSHIYNVKCFRANANGTVNATPGFPPAYLRTFKL